MTDYERAQADAAQDEEYMSFGLDWSGSALLVASVDGECVGIWRNYWPEWSHNLIDYTVELVDPQWENEL